MTKYFYTDGSNKFGPFTKEELAAQKLTRQTKVWCYGMDDWTTLAQVEDLKEIYNAIPPELNKKPVQKEVVEKEVVEKKLVQPEVPPVKIETKTSPIKKSNTSKPIKKWAIAIGALTGIALLTYVVFKNQSEKRIYNEIVKNAYDASEDFDMYVTKFYRDLEFYGIYKQKPYKQIIKFSELDKLEETTHIHGVSYGFEDDNKIEIYINPSSWKNFNKPMRYFLMYHELAHDILNLDDLEMNPSHEGKLMYPAISAYENVSMDDFIEAFQKTFEDYID